MPMNGSATLALEAIHAAACDEGESSMADATNQRIFDKLDAIQATQASTAADVARIQGSQKGIEAAIDVVKEAIGDVTETKIEARETKVRMENLEGQMAALKQSFEKQDTWARVETLVKWAVGGLAAGGSVAGVLKVLA